MKPGYKGLELDDLQMDPPLRNMNMSRNGQSSYCKPSKLLTKIDDSGRDEFGKALESLNTSFKIPKLNMVEPSLKARNMQVDDHLRRDIAKSLSSEHTQTYGTADGYDTKF